MKLPFWPDFAGERNIELGLDRVLKLLKRLGNPHLRLPPTIHIAGTNGKGSTLAFLQSIYEAAGLKVHRYTSPHLLDFNERIVVAGKPIDDDALTHILQRCKQAAGDDLPITFFEGTTVAAFLAFAEHSADVVLLETGLGGRLDATNVVPKPLATIITSIGLDHTAYLGDTIEAIAAEKGGIIKPKIPCIIAPQTHATATSTLTKIALDQQAQIFAHGQHWKIENNQCFGFDLMQKSLVGDYQIENAATAVATATLLKDSLAVSDEHINHGLQHAHWAGRLQHIAQGALAKHVPPNCQLWIDGAHNPEAAKQLAKQMSAWHADGFDVVPVVAMIKDKDMSGFLHAIAPLCSTIYGTHLANHQFGATGEQLQNSLPNLQITPNFKTLLQSFSPKRPTVFLACGSLYFIASLLAENSQC